MLDADSSSGYCIGMATRNSNRSLDSGDQRYGIAIVQKAFQLIEQQTAENKAWARGRHTFVSSGGYGGSCGGGGWSSGVAAGKRAKISAPGRIR